MDWTTLLQLCILATFLTLCGGVLAWWVWDDKTRYMRERIKHEEYLSQVVTDHQIRRDRASREPEPSLRGRTTGRIVRDEPQA